MNYFIGCCILFLLTCILFSDAEWGQDDERLYEQGFEIRERIRRAPTVYTAIGLAARLGKSAVDAILQGAEETESWSKYFRTFKKSGGLDRAFKDFDSVKPAHVSEFSWRGVQGKVGIVGDRAIILKSWGDAKKPTIEIVKQKKLMHMTIPGPRASHVTDIVRYMD